MSTETAAATSGVRIVRNAHLDVPSMGEPGAIANAREVHPHIDGSGLCGGFFELLYSQPLVFDYEYDEIKIVLEGELIVHDASTDTTLRAQPNDVLFIPKGARTTFTTPTRALAFYTHHKEPPA